MVVTDTQFVDELNGAQKVNKINSGASSVKPTAKCLASQLIF